MATNTEEQVTAFLEGMASSVDLPDTRVPGRVRGGARRRMAGWGAMTALAAGAVPAIAVLALGTLPEAHPPALGSGELIAFMRSGDDSHRIWVMEPDGSAQRPVSPAGIDAVAPSWARDGERIVYVRYWDGTDRENRIQILDLRSGRVETLPATPVGFPSGPIWSPDGSTIAFVDGIPGDEPGTFAGNGLYLISTSGEDLRLLTDEVGSNTSYSPDGREIVFERWVPNLSDDPAEAEHATVGLWAVNVATGSRRQITDVDGQVPQWSPDGRLIAYSDGAAAIWVVNADGTGGRRAVTDLPRIPASHPRPRCSARSGRRTAPGSASAATRHDRGTTTCTRSTPTAPGSYS